jgi:hypothetical protein
MPTGGGGTPPADAGQATCSCSGGHPPAAAVSAADISRPDTSCPDSDLVDTDLVDSDRGSGSSSGQPRRPRCPVPASPGHRPRCPVAAGRRRTGSRRCGATAGPRRSDLFVCAGRVARSTRPAEHGCPDGWTADAAWRTPGARTPRHCGHPRPPQGVGTLRQRPGWTAGQQDRPPPGNGVRPERDLTGRHRPACPADRQIRRLVVNIHAVVLSA